MSPWVCGRRTKCPLFDLAAVPDKMSGRCPAVRSFFCASWSSRLIGGLRGTRLLACKLSIGCYSARPIRAMRVLLGVAPAHPPPCKPNLLALYFFRLLAKISEIFDQPSCAESISLRRSISCL